MTALSLMHFEAGWDNDRHENGFHFSSAAASFQVIEVHHPDQPQRVISAHQADKVAFVRCARTGELLHRIDLNHHDAHDHLARYHTAHHFRLR